MPDTNLLLVAYPGSDHWEEFRCRDAETGLYVIWSDFTNITFTVRGPSTGPSAAKELGPLVTSVNLVGHPDFFDVIPGSEWLRLFTSNLAGLEIFKNYECLLKVHDVTRTRGQVLGDYKPDSRLPDILLGAWPGE